ncbi:MAG TPA: arabinofuranosidase catalytic domain-containing protein [Bacteroidia bacterium]|nr:arabinofuranosidase catalytic domain-containing protein [Bacteroidia bacterium]
MGKNYFLKSLLLLSFWLVAGATHAQVAYGAQGVYSLRLVVPTYTGNAIQIRRTCDNATTDVGFSCGALNTNTIDRFVQASNPLSTLTSSSAAAFSLRKLSCVYAGNAVNVRRSCDNATQDIGFTTSGDFDTTSLQKFVFKSSPLSAISSSAAGAYSLRKLYCSYAGNAINVRRSIDNTTQDIGFTSTGDLDTATLKTFVGTGGTRVGYITKWYDQSGNGNNAVQATAANQPQIMTGGKVNRQNSIPTMVFDGSTSYFTIPYAATTMSFTNASTCNAVLARTAAAGGTCDAVFCQQYTGGNISTALSWNSLPAPGTTLAYGYYPPGWQNAELPTDVTINTDNIITGTILSGAANTTAINLYQNGTLQAAMTNQTTVGTESGLAFNIGKRWDLANYAPINLQELIVFTSVLSTTDRQYLEFSQSAYYSISGPPSLSAIPVAAPSAYITKWYDQSGNTRDASQATTTAQPRIMNAGVIDRQNNLPAIYFGGLAYSLSTAAFKTYTAAACFNGVARVNTDLTYNTIVNKTGTGSGINYPGPLDFYNNQFLAGNGTSGSYTACTMSQTFNAATTTSLGIWSYQSNGTSNNGMNAWYNSTQVLTNAKANFFGDNTTPLYLGSRADGVTGLNGWLSEVITFNTIPSTTDRAYLEYTQGLYYGVSGPTLGTLPASPANAYITKWYDQSGNGNNLTQATTGNQPRIVNAGVIDVQNSLPSIHFDGAATYLTGNAFTTAFNNTVGGTLNAIAANNGASAWQGLAQQGRTGATWWGIWDSNTGKYTGGFASGPGNLISTVNSSVFESTTLIQLPATSTTLYGNGTSVSTSASVVNASNALSFYVGYADNASEYWNGYASEVTVFATGLNTTRRTLLETNQGSYFGLTPSNSKYTSASGYNLYVSGVGRTSATDSVADSRQSVGMGLIVGTTGTDYLKDNGDYITIGTTCPTAAVTTSLNMPVGATAGYERWTNDWYLNKTDVNTNGGTVKIFFDFSDYGVSGTPANASNYQLWGRASTAANFTVVPTTGVAISGDRVVFTLDANSLGSTGYYTIGTVDYQNSPLPIELLSFTAVPDEDKVNIAWETITETNNAYFTVEKSKDGINFTKVIDVPGAGNSTTYRNYAEVDYQPYDGTSYYRLKQTDNNGAYKYFTMVPVNFKARKNILVYPNPITNANDLHVKVSGFENQEVTVVLRDVQGREFITKVFLTMEGNDIFVVEETKTLQPGTYIVTASTNDKIFNYKLVVR